MSWFVGAPDPGVGQTEEGRWFRADGDCVCSVCKKTYYRHPEYPLFRFLRILCDGSLVKL